MPYRRTTKRVLRAALAPVLIAGAGVWLLVGCIYIPTFNKVVSGRDVSSKLGGERSNRPIRVGHSTRADVIRLLGEPTMTSRDWPRIAYRWNVMSGLIVLPLCFSANPMGETRAVVLTFDERDVLVSYRLTPHPVEYIVDTRRPRPTPPGPFSRPPETSPNDPATTRPTTAP